MDILLLGIYSFFVWLIFIKFKWLPWNITSQVIVVTIPIVALTILILVLNIGAPSSHDVRVINYSVQIVPRVTGRVIDVPVVGIVVFWLVHILPEKIAEKKRHPQAKAIQVLCLLSLVFGGLLWPIAWLWAYTKPVLHKMAYGTDVDDSHGHGADEQPDGTVPVLTAEAEVPVHTAARKPAKQGG